MPIGGGELILQPALLQPAGVVGHQPLLQVGIQRHQQVLRDAVLLHIQGAAQNQIRHLALGEGQADRAVPLRVLHLVKIHVHPGLFLDLPEVPHIAEIHGDVLDLILQGREGGRGSRRLRAFLRWCAAAQQQGRRRQKTKHLSALHPVPLCSAIHAHPPLIGRSWYGALLPVLYHQAGYDSRIGAHISRLAMHFSF